MLSVLEQALVVLGVLTPRKVVNTSIGLSFEFVSVHFFFIAKNIKPVTAAQKHTGSTKTTTEK